MLDKLAYLFPPKLIRTLHLYSSMLMLVVMLFFTVTGITLNHQNWFSSDQASELHEMDLPESLLSQLIFNEQQSLDDQTDAWVIAAPLIHWLRQEHGIRGQAINLDWDPEERFLVIDTKRPGGYSLAEFDLATGRLTLERRNAGTIAILNDLHKGRHSGAVWQAFIDVSALVMLLFTLTGFWLLLPQKKRRARLFGVCGLGTGLSLLLYWSAL